MDEEGNTVFVPSCGDPGEVANSDVVPSCGDPREHMDYIAIQPSRGPRERSGEVANYVIFCALCWVSPRKEGLHSNSTHL